MLKCNLLLMVHEEAVVADLMLDNTRGSNKELISKFLGKRRHRPYWKCHLVKAKEKIELFRDSRIMVV